MSTKNLSRSILGVGAVSVSLVLLAACGSSGGSSGTAPAGGGTTASGAAPSTVTSGLKTESTSIGTVAADPSGKTLYELVGDSTASPKCTGSCLSVWPAAMVNGTQVVLQGHPAHTFSGDMSPGQVTGQGATDQWGTWYALDSNGAPITSSAPASGSSSSSSSSSGGSGGYVY